MKSGEAVGWSDDIDVFQSKSGEAVDGKSHLASLLKLYFLSSGRIASAPDDRISLVTGGCNTPLTKELYSSLNSNYTF